MRTEKTLCLTVWLIACHAHARTPAVAQRRAGRASPATTIDVATTATGMPGYRMQDTGHFWAGTADIAYFSAHTEICSGSGGICNDADNDLKFIKNSKICVAKNMQLEGRGKQAGGEGCRKRKHLPSPKTNVSQPKYSSLLPHCCCCCRFCLCSAENTI